MYTRCVLWSQVACSLARDSRIPCAAPREKQQATTHHQQPPGQAKHKATTHKCCACASRLAHLEPHANTRVHHHQQAEARNTPRVRIFPSFLMPSPSHHQPITATISHITTASFAVSSAARSTCPITAHPMHILCTLLAGGSRSLLSPAGAEMRRRSHGFVYQKWLGSTYCHPIPAALTISPALTHHRHPPRQPPRRRGPRAHNRPACPFWISCSRKRTPRGASAGFSSYPRRRRPLPLSGWR